MRTSLAKKSDANGLTLIELLAVILIAGLLAAMSVPTFQAILKGTALKTASKALTDTLSLGRQFAITNRYLYRVELDDDLTAAESSDDIDDLLQKHRYRIYYMDRRGTEVTVRKWRLLPESVKYDLNKKPPKEIVFKPNGGANAYNDSGSQIFQFAYVFKIVHTQSGPEGKMKAMEINVNGITGTAKSKEETT